MADENSRKRIMVDGQLMASLWYSGVCRAEEVIRGMDSDGDLIICR